MAHHISTWRFGISTLAVVVVVALSEQVAVGQYTWVTDTDSSANWFGVVNWTDGGSNDTFPNAAGATALINAPISSATSNYTLAIASTNITVGELKIENAGWAQNYQVNMTAVGGGQLTLKSNTSNPARYIETAGTATTSPSMNCCRYTINPVINVESDWEINHDAVPFLNTGTTFASIINGDSTKTITKNGVGNIQFNANVGLLPAEGFLGKYVINQGGVRLIGTSPIIKSTGITVNSGGQLQLADNAGTAVPDWDLASGAVLKLNGAGKTVIGASQPNQATIEGALRIGITSGRTTTFHNPVELQSDANINVAAANTIGVLDKVVSGTGDLIKSGAGKLTLTANNTYTGDTRVTGNVLSISNPYLADAADVYMSTGTVFDLNFAATDTIRSLYFAGVAQPIGTYGATGSGAAIINDTFFTGTGVLNVTAEPVPGDFNNNGTVDAADYVLWRMGGPLANQVSNPNVVDAQDYIDWQNRFGNPNPGVGLGVGNVPEPTACLLAMFGLVGLLTLRGRR